MPPLSDEQGEIARQLIELRIEHRDLDGAILRLVADPKCDELQLRRMNKRKLRVKEAALHWTNSGTTPYDMYDQIMDSAGLEPLGTAATGDFGRYKNPDADAALKVVFGGKATVSMFDMTKLVSKHLS